jgi:hypothetical protein
MPSISEADALLFNRFLPSNDLGPPVPLEEGTRPPPFPLDVLPEPVRWFVEGGARALGCPVDFLALPAQVGGIQTSLVEYQGVHTGGRFSRKRYTKYTRLRFVGGQYPAGWGSSRRSQAEPG